MGGIFLLGYLLKGGQFGTDLEDIVLAVPVFGGLYQYLFKPSTYYRTDTTLTYQAMVHTAVLEVVDQVLSAKGARALTEFERKPIMRKFYER
jgi:type II secretory pathway component PulF